MTQAPDPSSGPSSGLVAPPARPGSNLPEYSVGDLARALKRTIEDAYGVVRVRGEISAPKRHGSGHIYMRLKDETAVIEAVCWRGAVAKLAIQPEDGLEVVVGGRITTYPGRSQYQLIIETMELAGEGALLKMLEERKRRLAAEGLFEPSRKKPIPFLPSVIGVVTSPTGAVIRDILHRLADRFPRPVLIWPVAVQGDGAAAQIAAAIQGFNALLPGGAVPRPEVLIVARGGGSLEDLMAFNEEVVVRAAAASVIPLISAVGHETDTTLIDHASDRRAPTPTAAAEMAVPVRAELLVQLLDDARRLFGSAHRLIGERRARVEGLARGLTDPRALIEGHAQRLDDRGERLELALAAALERRARQLALTASRLVHPRDRLAEAAQRLASEGRALDAALRQAVAGAARRFERVAGGLTRATLSLRLDVAGHRLAELAPGLTRAAGRRLDEPVARLKGLAALLESYSYENTLKRGFVVVRGPDGQPLAGVGEAAAQPRLVLQFNDGTLATVPETAAPQGSKAKPPAVEKRPRPSPQGSLF